jgi:hypothetical protein
MASASLSPPQPLPDPRRPRIVRNSLIHRRYHDRCPNAARSTVNEFYLLTFFKDPSIA